MTAGIPPLTRGIIAWSILLAVVAGGTVALLAIAIARTPVEHTASIVVVPHPDDEFQTWSLVEDTPDEYKIFVSLTRGDETGFCEPDIRETSLQADLGERAPDPDPPGRWTPECMEARQNSLLGYLTQMSESDPTIPGDFGAMTEYTDLPAEGVEICHDDDGVRDCDASLRTARVWKDAAGRGAVVFFDLGDGDLTQDEAAWALQTLIANRDTWGLDPARVGAMIGAFANEGHSCYSYPHPDHVAVHQVLWNVDFGVGPQVGATCFLDPRQRMSAFVSPESAAAAFALGPNGERLGAHGRNYGWLHDDAFPLAGIRQNDLFMSFQSFWVRFN
ncbi:hypothetical protein GCM10009775_18370 [Microbacterium aoyamense]|uniref:Uncharacterized protein n=1 Tax=Microbacterium aoyamense TaxID=344166 RepID=A0ABN2PP71_9MICO|nr:hypothetical protein [Microbacterium aoyamense]